MKIKKIEKERKKNGKKGINNPSPSEIMLLESINQFTLTNSTPSEIRHFVKADLPAISS
jgi:hypothetical protein